MKEEEQHKFCPKNKVQHGASTVKTKKYIYNRKKYLPEVFCSELLPIFEQLSLNELLDSCQK